MDPLFLIIFLCVLVMTWISDLTSLRKAKSGAVVCYGLIAASTLLLFVLYIYNVRLMLPTQMVATYIVPIVKAWLHIQT